MRICIIGNSQSVCFLYAWKKMAAGYPEDKVTVFLSGGQYFGKFIPNANTRSLSVDGEGLKNNFKRLSGGESDIKFDDFDLCLIIGGMLTPLIDKIAALGGESKLGYSQQVIEAATLDAYETLHARVLVRKIKETSSDIPVKLIHDPFLAPPEHTSSEDMVCPYADFDYAAGVTLINEKILEPMNCELLMQPEETLATPFVTKAEYCRGNRLKWGAGEPVGDKVFYDRGHMTVEYGELVLKKVIGAFKANLQDSDIVLQ